MIELLPLSIGLGLVVSLLFSELLGLAAGGMVVPGYVALFLNRPLAVALTLAAGFVTFGIVRGLSSIMIVYGRRRTVLMVLVGFLVGVLFRFAASHIGTAVHPDAQITVIGYIIPGLIGIWFDRQGVLETLSVLLTASVMVRLVLILTMGQELLS